MFASGMFLFLAWIMSVFMFLGIEHARQRAFEFLFTTISGFFQ